MQVAPTEKSLELSKKTAGVLRSKFFRSGSFDYALTVVKAKASPSASLASRPSAAAAHLIATACVSPAM